MNSLNAWGDRHRHAIRAVRFGVGALLLGFGGYLCSQGVWWGALFIVPAALHFYLGYRAVNPRP